MIASLIGGIVSFIAGFLIYSVLLGSFFASHSIAPAGVMKAEPDFIFLFLGNLAYGILIAYIFVQWAGIKTVATGAKAAATIGLLVAASWDFIQYGLSNTMDMTGLMVDIIASIIMSAIVGAAIGAYLGR